MLVRQSEGEEGEEEGFQEGELSALSPLPSFPLFLLPLALPSILPRGEQEALSARFREIPSARPPNPVTLSANISTGALLSAPVRRRAGAFTFLSTLNSTVTHLKIRSGFPFLFFLFVQRQSPNSVCGLFKCN